jgi:hypothetical protein
VNETMQQLKGGVEPSKVVFEKRLPVIWDCSVGWLVNADEAINNCELVEKVIQPFTHLKSFPNCVFLGI